MTNRLRSVLHPDSGRSSRVRRVILMMFISFSLGESVCDVLASRMASATPAQHLHCLSDWRATAPKSRSAGWRAADGEGFVGCVVQWTLVNMAASYRGKHIKTSSIIIRAQKRQKISFFISNAPYISKKTRGWMALKYW